MRMWKSGDFSAASTRINWVVAALKGLLPISVLKTPRKFHNFPVSL
jgi:hypothetical protein